MLFKCEQDSFLLIEQIGFSAKKENSCRKQKKKLLKTC